MIPGYNLKCDVIRVSFETNEVGDQVESTTVVAENVPCRLASREFFRREHLNVLGGGAVDIASHIAIFPADTDVRTTDRLDVNDKEYEIVWLDDIDQLGHHQEALVKHVGGVT